MIIPVNIWCDWWLALVPYPTPICKYRRNRCLLGTVLVHSMLCKSNRSFTVLILFCGLLGDITDQLKMLVFFYSSLHNKVTPHLDFLMPLSPLWWGFAALSNNKDYYLLSNYNVTEHRNIYVYVSIFTEIYLHV